MFTTLRYVVVVGLFFAVLSEWSVARGEEALSSPNVSETTDYPVIDTSELTYSTHVDWLMPWLDRYHSFNGDFKKQNALAFQLAKRGYGWTSWMSLMMGDPRTSRRTRQAIIHLASANYTNVDHWHDWHEIELYESHTVKGALEILRSARPLKPDGSDAAWPEAGHLDPRGMPQRIARVLKVHPQFARDAILTLKEYGPLALKEAEDLMPFLLSDNPQIAAVAYDAICTMDPQGIANLFQLEKWPMTERQVNMVRGYKAAKLDTSPDIQQFYDLRESDGSPLSDLSRMRHEFHRIMQFKSILRSFDWEEPPGQKELAFFLCDQIPSGEWWKLLCLEYIDGEEQPDGQYLHCASALYTKPGARDEMLRVLHDDDPCIAAAMSNLLGDMRLYTQRVVMLGEVEYAYGDLVDPEVIPAELVKVMERHPHLKVHMAGILSIYGSHAASHVNKIVPLLLSDDPLDVQLIRSYMTNIDPKLAGELEITSEIYGSLWEEYEQLNRPEALNARQRQLIEDYLKTIK